MDRQVQFYRVRPDRPLRRNRALHRTDHTVSATRASQSHHHRRARTGASPPGHTEAGRPDKVGGVQRHPSDHCYPKRRPDNELQRRRRDYRQPDRRCLGNEEAGGPTAGSVAGRLHAGRLVETEYLERSLNKFTNLLTTN